MAGHSIGAADMLRNGEMKRLDLDGKPVVLARAHDQYYAFAAECTHYHADLSEGVLKGHTVMCPWHHACFDIRSGVRLEPPALNDLESYSVSVVDDKIVVELDDQPVQAETAPQTDDPRAFVIVGGGAAGHMAAETLRREGFTGSITLISAIDLLPVDRPNVSKDYLAGDAPPEWMPLRDNDWYKDHNITLKLKTRVTHIDSVNHRVHVEGGDPILYDKLLLATGGTPRTLRDTPGSDLKGIFTLREQPDAETILAALKKSKSKQVVIIGASFIGMEAAVSLTKQGGSVTVVEMEAVPFARVFGQEIGRMFQAEHEKNNVQFRMGVGVDRIEGKDGAATGVTLKSGETLAADLIVLGIGVSPNTDYLADSGLAMTERENSVRVDNHLQTSSPDIYAAGDIARYADPTTQDGRRIEHWRVALQHGMIAARNMLDLHDHVSEHVPFFWTTQWNITLNYVGNATAWDAILVRGDVEKQDFIAFFVSNGALQAAAGANRDQEMDAIEFILRDHMALTPEQMKDESFDLIAYSKR